MNRRLNRSEQPNDLLAEGRPRPPSYGDCLALEIFHHPLDRNSTRATFVNVVKVRAHGLDANAELEERLAAIEPDAIDGNDSRIATISQRTYKAAHRRGYLWLVDFSFVP